MIDIEHVYIILTLNYNNGCDSSGHNKYVIWPPEHQNTNSNFDIHDYGDLNRRKPSEQLICYIARVGCCYI